RRGERQAHRIEIVRRLEALGAHPLLALQLPTLVAVWFVSLRREQIPLDLVIVWNVRAAHVLKPRLELPRHFRLAVDVILSVECALTEVDRLDNAMRSRHLHERINDALAKPAHVNEHLDRPLLPNDRMDAPCRLLRVEAA